MFSRAAYQNLNRFSISTTLTGSMTMKASFSSSITFPSWRKCGVDDNVLGKIHCHMISTHCLKNRPNSAFQKIKFKSGKELVSILANSGSLRNYCKIFSILNPKASKVEDCSSQTKYYSTTASSSSSSNMGGKGPGLIVFDLDCTLWPLHVDTTHNPPFIQKDDKIVDQDGRVITYYPEVPEVLEYLKNEGFAIGAASRTTKPPAAEQLLKFFDWNKYFSYKEIYPGSKVTHFARFVEQTGLPHEQMLFFDDEQRNIIDMKQQGVKCVFVENGVTLQLVKDSIEQFKNGSL